MSFVLSFLGGGQVVQVRLEKEHMAIKSIFTKQVWLRLTPNLFRHDRQKHAKMKLLARKYPSLTQDEKEVYVTLEFGKMGYTLVKKENEEDEQP